ncbi:hypothetical protein QJS10_CPA05g01153 [Acorus calamus]|uniref:Transcription repressor n=1 Tax=Acorus calamus TaxID=4465 RepID=A0AAV9EU75_ACOCL|nr:hypothetical protein QJS10_CPA05g01153 [Acorus calamus]
MGRMLAKPLELINKREEDMAKNFKIKISRLMTSILPPEEESPTVCRRRHVPVVSVGCGCRSSLLRRLRRKPFSHQHPHPTTWHALAATDDPPRRKVDSDDGVVEDLDRFLPSIKNRPCTEIEGKKRHGSRGGGIGGRISISNSSADNNWFSSEGDDEREDGDDDDETETLVSSTDTSSEFFKPRRRKSKKKKRMTRGMEGKVMESFAVVKRSKDPRGDFRRSMVEMILEKEMFEKRELEQLLRCFLSLNHSCHHEVIVDAFSEIWVALFCESIAPSEKVIASWVGMPTPPPSMDLESLESFAEATEASTGDNGMS